jgi:hypothetical protein
VVPVRNLALQSETILPTGITVAFDDPGDSFILLAALAEDFTTLTRYLSGSFYGGTDVFSVTGDVTVTLGEDLFRRVTASAAMSSLVNLDANFSVTFSNDAAWSWGEIVDPKRYYNTMINTTGATFSNIRRYSKSYYEIGGVSAGVFYQLYYTDRPDFTLPQYEILDEDTGIETEVPGSRKRIPYYWYATALKAPPVGSGLAGNKPGSNWATDTRFDWPLYQNLGLDLLVRLPRVLPFQNPDGFTFNLPLGLGVTLFPNPDVFMQYYLSTVLFGMEIQRAIPKLNLFFRRFSIQAQYSHSAFNQNHSYEIFETQFFFTNLDDLAYSSLFTLAFVPELGINTGALVNAGLEVSLELRVPVPEDRLDPPYEFGINFRLRI